MMTITDISELLNLLEIAYGKKNLYSESSKDNILKLWEVMFRDDDPVEVANAVKDCIATLQVPPKIADLKSRIAKQRTAGQMTEMEAWQMICQSIEKSYGRDDAN